MKQHINVQKNFILHYPTVPVSLTECQGYNEAIQQNVSVRSSSFQRIW